MYTFIKDLFSKFLTEQKCGLMRRINLSAFFLLHHGLQKSYFIFYLFLISKLNKKICGSNSALSILVFINLKKSKDKSIKQII
jgi:hypothetical protein